MNVELLSKAVLSRSQAESMTGAQLDAWYLEHVGYSPVADNPGVSPAELTAMAAAAMFFRLLPNGLETPGAEYAEAEMTHAIMTNRPLPIVLSIPPR